MERVEQVREFLARSKAESTRRYAKFPTLFRQIAQEHKSVPLLAGACDRAWASLPTFQRSCYKRTVAFPLHRTSRPLKKAPTSLTMESPVLTGASEKSPYLRARSLVAIET